MTTDCLTLDVLRSTTTASGELCVIKALPSETHKSHVVCSDIGDSVFFQQFVTWFTFPTLLRLTIRRVLHA